jgi:hypothetical protein
MKQADPHDQPGGPLVVNLAAFWQQRAPIVPVLPIQTTRKCCSVYNLRFDSFHGMEELTGSIPMSLQSLHLQKGHKKTRLTRLAARTIQAADAP